MKRLPWRLQLTGESIAIAALLILGICLRTWQYWYFPVAGETQDEVAWTLLGASLLQTGEPVSWSYFSGYTVLETITHQGAEFPLVKPVLDHPPLFALLPGFMQTMVGENWKSIPSIKVVRFPVVFLSVINLGLFAWWIKRLQRSRAFWLTALGLVATAPSLVFLSRLVVSENLLVTWLLLILLLQTEVKDNWTKWLWLVVHAALPLTKVSGLAIMAASVVEAWLARDRRRFRWALLGSSLGLILFLAYMSWFDWDLFWQVQTQQAQRETGLLTLFSTWLWQPTLVREVFADIWNQVGLMVLLGLSVAAPYLKNKQQKTTQLVLLLFWAQLAFLLLSVGEHTIHGWYRIVFWPLWVYAISMGVENIWHKRNGYGLAAIVVLTAPMLRLGLVFTWGAAFYQYQGGLNKVALGVAGLAVLSTWLPSRYQKMVQQSFLMIWGGLLLVSQTLTVLLIQHPLFWQDALYLLQGIRP